MTDPIADLLTIIRNAYLAKNQEVNVPHSQMKEKIVRILTREGYLDSYRVKKTKPQAQIIIKLKYINKKPALTHIERVSKPGRRVYLKAKDIRPILSNFGLAVLSTNKGLITNTEGAKQKVGGEYLLKVW